MQILTISDTLGLRGVIIAKGVKVTPITEQMLFVTVSVNDISWTIPVFTPMEDNWEELRELRYIGTAKEILIREEKEMTVADHFYNGRWEQVRAAVRKASGERNEDKEFLKNFLIFKIKPGA